MESIQLKRFEAFKIMPRTHAVVAIAHDHAQILEFDAEHLKANKVRAYAHPTARHNSGVRSEHEFFAHVCDSIDQVDEVLVTGTRVAVTDFSRFLREHRPPTSMRVLGYEVVNHPTQKQLVALARQFFVRVDGVRTLGVFSQGTGS